LKSNTKKLFLFLLLLFFISVPFIQSLLFSSKNEGSFYLNKEIQADFLHSNKPNLLVYFGYVGCNNICTPFLHKLNLLYESAEFQALQKDTDVFFVNLTSNIEPSQADGFAKNFNKNFKGIYLSKKEVQNLDRNYKLFFSDDLIDKNKMNHTDYLYLIRNHNDSKILKNIYFTHPLRTQKLIHDIIRENEIRGNNE